MKKLAAVLLAAACLAARARGQDVAAVLSSSPGPYQAGYDSFVSAYGRRVPSWRLPAPRPATAARARVIVAFGGEAAAGNYGEETTLIACMAPGLAGRLPHRGPRVLVAMKPDPRTLADRLRSVQPKLRRLGVLGNADDTDSWSAELRRAGLEVVVAKPAGPDAVPEALRGLAGKVDALWLSPDPTLVTPQSFQTIKQFSWDHATPFYAPTSGLAAAGAAASIAVVPKESGRRAAELARKAAAGDELPQLVYPAVTEMTLNPESAGKAGLTFTPGELEKADRVIK